MKKKMISMTLISFAALLISGVVYYFAKIPFFFSMAITFGTMFYHLGVRLAVGHFIDAKYQNHMDYTKKWFAEKPFEKKLYKILRVNKWKKNLPTYNPEYFDIKKHSVEEIVQVTCQAEVVHEVNMPLSLVPIIFSIWFGSLGVFIITSCAAFLFDSIFVIMQRYNRPRLMRLMKNIPGFMRTDNK